MIVSVAYFILYFFLFLFLLALLVFKSKRYRSKINRFPNISILVAARNEEQNIIRCLSAIEALDYPKDKIEVLIGNDGSTDQTRELIDAFIKDKPNYKCLNITACIGQAKGKPNVLAQLAKLATSNLFFYTDADIAVPPSWVKGMLANLKDNVGVVTGITTTQQKGLFANLQAMDWLYALSLMQVVSDLKLPVTAMGNNMLLRREAYEQVGGYESIPFSITEDIAIFNRILANGWEFRNIYSKGVLAISTPVFGLKAFLHQRKRWMKGSMHLPLYMAFIFVIHAAYYPVLLPFFAYTSGFVAFAILGLKVALQSIFIYISLRRLGRTSPWWLYLLFELYLVITSIVVLVYFFMPVKTVWKGRRY